MSQLIRICLFLSIVVISSGCRRSSDEVWNDTKSAGRHVSRGVKTLGGKHGESRQVRSHDDFEGRVLSDEFVPFEDEAKADMRLTTAQPSETPGEPGSAIPGFDAFKDPEQDQDLKNIFKLVHFDYNSSLIKNDANFSTIQKIANWMMRHPKVYLLVEGHCDDRGSAAFNFTLGANRANSIRDLLIREGVHPDHIFTISYGKEVPIVIAKDENAWRKNRRGQFKIYERR